MIKKVLNLLVLVVLAYSQLESSARHFTHNKPFEPIEKGVGASLPWIKPAELNQGLPLSV